MRHVDCRHLLEKDNPDALVLAIFCDFGDHDPQAVVNHIYTRLRALLRDDDKRFREYVDILHILSGGRDLKRQIEEAEKMLTQIDVERMPYYQLGMERGIERGMELGRDEGETALFIRLLGYKFGGLPPVLEQRIRDAESEELALWEQRMLSAGTLDEVFASL
ncbi:MAG: hypothetical protein BECKG1743D_GA0114223_105365 [Candidatus Kentron sp. G]|nr:MAG: hypothetical protein BECKG1743F_GA0114225_102856 [Candidatus Kentron sp. G]VFN02219.1 MAG: hypothetical protein BECKG1743E_GA0114224_104845 [Candidatus Kentron sp. G]VFN03997.1 MAG: hypothetical protein BECKG1743D_GA0114223_105365 [Candidatus Kentron sp. G]